MIINCKANKIGNSVGALFRGGFLVLAATLLGLSCSGGGDQSSVSLNKAGDGVGVLGASSALTVAHESDTLQIDVIFPEAAIPSHDEIAGNFKMSDKNVDQQQETPQCGIFLTAERLVDGLRVAEVEKKEDGPTVVTVKIKKSVMHLANAEQMMIFSQIERPCTKNPFYEKVNAIYQFKKGEPSTGVEMISQSSAVVNFNQLDLQKNKIAENHYQMQIDSVVSFSPEGIEQHITHIDIRVASIIDPPYVAVLPTDAENVDMNKFYFYAKSQRNFYNPMQFINPNSMFATYLAQFNAIGRPVAVTGEFSETNLQGTIAYDDSITAFKVKSKSTLPGSSLGNSFQVAYDIPMSLLLYCNPITGKYTPNNEVVSLRFVKNPGEHEVYSNDQLLFVNYDENSAACSLDDSIGSSSSMSGFTKQ